MKKLTLAFSLAMASQLFAGGFWLQLGNPDASAEARQHNAVLMVKAVGCHDPAHAQLSAKATSLVNGKLETIDLKLTPLSEPGAYALAQQWPATGRWVIQISGRNGEQFTNSLVAAGPEGVDRLHAKADRQAFSEADVRAMLVVD